MRLLLSVVLVAAVIALLAINLRPSDELQLGARQLIHSRVPWLLLVTLVVGTALGLSSVLARPAWYKYLLVGLEVLVTALIGFMFLRASPLPAHALSAKVGDPFPAVMLPAHDGRRFDSRSLAGKSPALYIFYRGDW